MYIKLSCHLKYIQFYLKSKLKESIRKGGGEEEDICNSTKDYLIKAQ